ncbi:MAG TPA: N-acetylgalactosamine 6-sulfate sulfatase, partial [Opitutae bacterium]|nr:N-acetylgalactosamine 6-sulfate sulfatase [Opitutae bacterium]
RKHLRKLGIEKNTLFLYCSDNGGLVTESSGGRAKKGSIYEGGLRVPAVLEWPSRFSSGKINLPVFSSDLYPTFLSIAGIKLKPGQPMLDGIDLLPVLDGQRTSRPAMGFWHGFQNGQGTWNDRIIKALLEAEQAGKPNPFPERILKNVKEFPTFDPSDLRGHAAWNDWPWKLHRIETRAKVVYELYDLKKDPMETTDLSEKEPVRVAGMKKSLENWQRSVLRSWAGKDY